MVAATDAKLRKKASTDTYLPYPSSSAAVVYGRHYGDGEDYPLDKTLGFLVEDLQRGIPGLTKCEKWMDGDGVAVLENRFAYIGISEHFGRIAVWACPKDRSDSKAIAWAKSVEGKLKEGVTNCIGGTSTLSEMLRSSPMPKYSKRPKQCLGKRMTVGELMQALMYMDEAKEVRIAFGPNDPQQFAIGGVATPFTCLMWKQPVVTDTERTVILAAGDSLGRVPDSAAAQFGWATRSNSLKAIQGEGN